MNFFQQKEIKMYNEYYGTIRSGLLLSDILNEMLKYLPLLGGLILIHTILKLYQG